MFKSISQIALIIICTIHGFSTVHSQCDGSIDGVTISNDYREHRVGYIGTLSGDINADSSSNYTVIPGLTSFSLGFTKGVWAGGYDPLGTLRLAAGTYPRNASEADFTNGPYISDATEKEASCLFFKRAWKITGAEILRHKQLFNSAQLELGSIPIDLLEWPALGNPYIGRFAPQEEMAPYYDNNKDGIYDPMTGDYPIALLENPDFIPFELRFVVFNDDVVHRASYSEPMKMEFHQLDYVVNCVENIESEQSVFTRLKYIYHGEVNLSGFKLGIFNDLDLGCYLDDYFGCSESLNCNYVYNASGSDRDICHGVDAAPSEATVVRSLVFLNRDISGFLTYNAGGGHFPATAKPVLALDYYHYLSGRWLDGTAMTSGANFTGSPLGYNTGQTDTTYLAFPDRPDVEGGWSMYELELPIQDYRTITTIEAKELRPGDASIIDFVDHLLYDEVNRGLNVFSVWEDRIGALKSEFQSMLGGNFDCISNSSNTHSIQEKLSFKVFPNPANSDLKISFKESSNGSIFIYNIAGTLVEEQKLYSQNNMTISVFNYEPGFYLISYRENSGNISSSYFVRN